MTLPRVVNDGGGRALFVVVGLVCMSSVSSDGILSLPSLFYQHDEALQLSRRWGVRCVRFHEVEPAKGAGFYRCRVLISF